MNKSNADGMKLCCGGQEATKEQMEQAIADYEKKITSAEFQEELERFSDFMASSKQSSAPKTSPNKRNIDYYEFPNGTVVKSVRGDHVYRFDPVKRLWEVDHSLSAQFAWDRPYGESCENLRKKADVDCELPPFPNKYDFFPGSSVFIGAYPQRNPYDFSPVEWIVLETDSSTALCITKDCLITSGYCDPEKAYGKREFLWWENSLGREICNRHFFETAFSEEEKARIIPKEMTEVQLGAKCTDPVFLLSEREVLRYFPLTYQRKAKPTPYAIQQGARLGWTDDTREYTSWWLLPEENAYGHQDGSIYPKAVFQMGEILFHSRNMYHGDFTIRPCIQIKYTND